MEEPFAAQQQLFPAEWATRVEAGYDRMNRARVDDIAPAARAQLHAELSMALATGLGSAEGDYRASWVLALPGWIEQLVGDAAAWQAHLARTTEAYADHGSSPTAPGQQKTPRPVG